MAVETRGGRRAALVSVIAALVVAAAVVAGLDLTGRLPGGLVADPSTTPATTGPLDPSHRAAPSVLLPAPTSSPMAVGTVPVGELSRRLADPDLGGAAGAAVVDVVTGAVLFDHDATTPRTPASVAKLVTGAAVLLAYGPAHRFTTRVVSGPTPETVVLVGAGDATLTTRAPRPGQVPQRASLAALADATAAALKGKGTQPGAVTVLVDDSLFSGPAVSPDWRRSYVPFGVVSPVDALAVDAGRVRPGAQQRSADPARAAGRTFAGLLRRRGLQVETQVRRSVAPAGAEQLAAVESPTAAELVELMLQTSDNDLAEALSRLAAVADGRPGSFAGGTAAAMAALTELGVPTTGIELLDGSGLARGSRLPPITLARLLQAAADGSHPDLSALLEGLPVAAFSGTLQERFGGSSGAAGVVRAKTGTLTGVSSLAGTVSVAGRPVVFAALADGVPVGATLPARAALDRFAAALAAAGTGTPAAAVQTSPASQTPSASGG